MYSFSYLEPVCCSMSNSNCCFLTCIQISQEAGQVVWYAHLFENFPQFIVVHTVKGFGIVNKAEIDFFFWNSLAFSMIQWMLAIWSLIPLPFLKPVWTSGSSRFTYCWSLAWRILSITLLACDVKALLGRRKLNCAPARSVTQSCPTLCDPMDCSPPGSSMGFSRQEHWSGLLFPSPRDLPDLGIDPVSLKSPCVGRQVLYH